MNKQELITEYEKLKTKYNLPDWKEIDREFFLSFAIASWHDIPENTAIFIANRIMDYYGSWINFCHSLINGNPQSMILMREAEFFSPENKKELIEVMTELTVFTRRQTVVNLKNTEQDAAEFIKAVCESWMKNKPTIMKFAELSYDNWVAESKKVLKNVGNMD